MTFKVLQVILLLYISHGVLSTDTGDTNGPCDSWSLECLQFKFVQNAARVMRMKSFKLIDGIQLEEIPGAESAATGRSLKDDDLKESLSSDPSVRDKQMSKLFEDVTSRMLSSRSLKISLDSILPGMAIRISKDAANKQAFSVALDTPDMGRSFDAGRSKGGMKRILPLLLLFKYKAFIIASVGLVSVAGLAGAALLIGKLALLLSGIIGLKKLVGNDAHESISYVHQPAPYSHAHGRSLGEEASSTDSHKKAYRSSY